MIFDRALPMPLDLANLALFTVAAIVLLGSPGPGIAALISVGRHKGFIGGLRFYGGLQAGLAVAAAVSAAGLFSAVQALPFAQRALAIVATAYLLFLAWKIATAPVGDHEAAKTSDLAETALGGALLGVTNPKAYIAFASLMAAYPIVRQRPPLDLGIKWGVCVVVMVVVDLAWLGLGVAVGKARLSPRAERAMNWIMGGLILATALLAFV
jgi:threonine/homoserine/homoserine lactone efflux protein